MTNPCFCMGSLGDCPCRLRATKPHVFQTPTQVDCETTVGADHLLHEGEVDDTGFTEGGTV